MDGTDINMTFYSSNNNFCTDKKSNDLWKVVQVIHDETWDFIKNASFSLSI